MLRKCLRDRVPISYYEPEEPSFDEYVYCDQCADYVYEYCSLHGPLLVIPDNTVTSRSKFPSFVPRAALTIPHVFLHIAPSIIPGAGLGIFTTRTLPRGVRFGPYRGQRSEQVNSMYCWQIYDKNNKPSHVVDAADANKSNWMRYVNCARHWCEQNLVAYQYQGQLYYRSIKIIPKFTELLVFYGTECAEKLQIDLKMYNSHKHYVDVLMESTKIQQEIDYLNIENNNIIHENEVNFTAENSTHTDNEEKVIKDEFYDINYSENNEIIKMTFKDTEIIKNDVLLANNNNFITKTNKSIINSNFNTNNNNLVTITNNLSCHICNKEFSNKRGLRRHVLTHDLNKKYNCTFCTYKTNFKYMLDRHIGIHTQEFNFKCNICTYATNSMRYLTRHKRRHSKEKKHICEFCDYKTLHRPTMAYHLKMHEEKMSIKCDLCSFLAKNKKYLHRHVLNMHKMNNLVFFCDICGYSAFNKNWLMRHVINHNNISKKNF